MSCWPVHRVVNMLSPGEVFTDGDSKDIYCSLPFPVCGHGVIAGNDQSKSVLQIG